MMDANQYLKTFSEVLSQIQVTDRQGKVLSLETGVQETVETILSLSACNRKVFLVANGGSAALVSHMQNDLCAGVQVRALVFNEAPLLTALANDHGYQEAFERLVDLWADPGDLLIAVSSSGRSENILKAVQAAELHQCQVVTFSGFRPDNPLRSMGQVNFYSPSESYGFVEMSHMSLMHALTDLALQARRAEKKPIV